MISIAGKLYSATKTMPVDYDEINQPTGSANNRTPNNDKSINPIKSMNTEDIFQGSNNCYIPKRGGKEEIETDFQTPPRKRTRNQSRTTRTPDLARIVNFFKGRKSPVKLGKSLDNNDFDLESTPASKRPDSSKVSNTLATFNSKLEYRTTIPIEVDNLLTINKEAEVIKSLENLGFKLLEAFGGSQSNIIDKLNYSSQDTPPSQRKNETSLTRNNLNPLNVIDKLRIEQLKKNKTVHTIEDQNFGIVLNSCNNDIDEYNFNNSEEDLTVINLTNKIKSSSNNMPNKVGKENNNISLKNDDNSFDYSLVDDTTDINISSKWIAQSDYQHQINSNKSTQLIDSMGTQEPKSIKTQKIEETQTSLNPNLSSNRDIDTEDINCMETQILESSMLPGNSTQTDIAQISENNYHQTNILTQIIHSPDQNLLKDLKTPLNEKTTNMATLLEVPETKSPINNANKIHINDTNSSPTPKDRELTMIEGRPIDLDNLEKVYLQISSKIGLSSSQLTDHTNDLNTGRDIVIMSEIELTQELPEMEETTGNENRDHKDDIVISLTNGSQDKTRSKQILRYDNTNLPDNLEKRSGNSSPKRKSRNENERKNSNPIDNAFNDVNDSLDSDVSKGLFSNNSFDGKKIEGDGFEYPSAILLEDLRFLTKKDITFEKSVWCLYGMNYQFYPGLLLNSISSTNKSWILFEQEKELTNDSDIFYLDIRIGETVNWKGSSYVVFGLECRSRSIDVMRCIRGYDTVHLKRKKISGVLGKKTLVTSLGSISIGLDEWVKRTKIVTEDHPSDYTDKKRLSSQICGRISGFRSSPLKPINSNIFKNISNEDMNDIDSSSPQRHSSTTPVMKLYSLKSPIIHENQSNIFNGCLFILTSVFENRDELRKIIEERGGTVIDTVFSTYFDYFSLRESDNKDFSEYDLNLTMKSDSKFKDYRFACLLTERYSRSLKYLETLALGWPTLHWKFVKHCLNKGELAIESIFQFLLPAGESFRLATNKTSGMGTIKSNNIFHFYSNLLGGSVIDHQIDALRSKMTNYSVILLGSTELNTFIKFLFACLGVRKLYHISSSSVSALNRNIPPIIKNIKNTESDILVYFNDEPDNGILDTHLGLVKDSLELILQESRISFHVESMEWLIQTVINEDLGFEDV